MTLRLERKYNPRAAAAGAKGRGFAIGIAAFHFQHEDESPRLFRWGLAAALTLHVVAFVWVFPSWEREITTTRSAQKVFVLQQVRFQPPKPQQAPAQPKRKVRKVPIPDPTPDLPEPIMREDYKAPEPQIASVDIGDFAEIPEAPSIPGIPGLREMSSDLIPPRKLYAPQPAYTEEARQARVQGMVLIRAIVDALGNVTNPRILKGLPSGLADSAVDTVLTWRYEPAMTRAGEPVAVYYNFTINFALQ